MTDYIDLIGNEIETKIQELNQVPESVGMFTIKSASRTIREAAQRPDPNPLWLSLWYEGECCCLFSDSNLGKSIYAVQIATEIAKKQRVLYFDFELSDKQFELRYRDEEGNLFQFPEEIYRVEINRDALDTSDFENDVIRNIEEAVVKTSAKVIVVDNITFLCNNSEKGDAAGQLMMKLIQLKRKYDLSTLVIAHTAKRPLSAPITQNDLAGSKKLYNFFDSVFAIGKSAKDNNIRYIKQLKCRFGEFTYDADNVIVCVKEMVGSFLQLTQIGFSDEREHLKEFGDEDKEALINQIKEMVGEGKSYRQVASELGISLAKVQRSLKTK